MAEPVDRELERIAQRVRRWREESGLTLQELGRRSGVATSTIQKVETLQMIPTVAVLLKIARGLGRRMSDFIGEGHDPLEIVHLRASDRHRIGMRKQLLFERLSGDLFDSELEMWRVDLQPGLGSGRGTMEYDGEELLLCEEGIVTAVVGEEEYRLEPGDTLHFKANVPHAWRNDGPEPARLIVIGTLPAALRSALHDRMKEGASVRAVARSSR